MTQLFASLSAGIVGRKEKRKEGVVFFAPRPAQQPVEQSMATNKQSATGHAQPPKAQSRPLTFLRTKAERQKEEREATPSAEKAQKSRVVKTLRLNPSLNKELVSFASNAGVSQQSVMEKAVRDILNSDENTC